MRYVRTVSAAGSDGRGASAPEAPARFRQSRWRGGRRPDGSACCGDPHCRFGSRAARPSAPTHDEHLKAREAFRAWAMAPERGASRDLVRRELRGRDLGCYCPPELPCHTDVLGIANGGPAEGTAAARQARGSDGRDYALRVSEPPGGLRRVTTDDGRAVAEDLRGNLWVSGTAVRLELVPEDPPRSARRTTPRPTRLRRNAA